MTEEPDKDALLESIKEMLDLYSDIPREIAQKIIEEDVSKYPIFVFHKKPVNIGRLALDKEVYATEWNISATTLEELVRKKVIFEGRVDAFRKIYKNPSLYACLFVITEKAADFIVLPYA